jgi:hypothetical protein
MMAIRAMTIPATIYRSILLPLPEDLLFVAGFFAMTSFLYNIMKKKARGILAIVICAGRPFALPRKRARVLPTNFLGGPPVLS